MYQAQTCTNGHWNTSPVRFVSEDLAMQHAEKLADQFVTISDYRTIPCEEKLNGQVPVLAF